MRLLPALACLALLPLAAPLAAQSLHWHAGVGLAGELDGRGPPAGRPLEAENAGTLLVGATHGSGFGVEAAYVDLGELVASNIADAGYEVDGELWSVGATYAIPLDAFEPYAKLGWFSRDEDGTQLTIAGPRPLRLDDDGVMGEVGLRWRASDAFALRLGYAHYDFEPDADGSAQLMAEWHFR
jgi:hypothetical protein